MSVAIVDYGSGNLHSAAKAFERAAHEQRVGDALPVVGEHPHPGMRIRHRAKLGQLFAVQADGHRTHRMHVAVAGVAASQPDLFDDTG